MSDVPQNVLEAVKAINSLGKECWLGTSADVYDFDPPRNPVGQPMANHKPEERKPMNRFVFMGDCFTSFDAEILPDGQLRVLFNNHLRKRYPEDLAFCYANLLRGSVVSPAFIVSCVQEYVVRANDRASEKPQLMESS